MKSLTSRSFWAWIALALSLTSAPAATVSAADAPSVIRVVNGAGAIYGRPYTGGAIGLLQARRGLETEFEKDGIRIEWIPVAGAGPGVNEVLASNGADFAFYGDFPATVGRAGGVRVKWIAPGNRGNNSYLVVPADSPAQTIHDLKGKRIALMRARPWEYPFARYIADEGYSYRDFQIVNLSVADGQAALAAKNVDALWGHPWALVDRGIARVIVSTHTLNKQYQSTAELFVLPEFERKYPQIVQRVVNQFVAAQAWGSDDANRQTVFEQLERAGASSIPAAEREHEGRSLRVTFNPLFDEFIIAHYHQLTAFLHEQRLVRRKVSVDDWYDTRYVEQALKTLGLEDFWTPQDAQGHAAGG